MSIYSGWTPDYVLDTLTIERLDAIRAEWKQCPPFAITMAGFAGYKAPETKDPSELLGEFPDGRLR